MTIPEILKQLECVPERAEFEPYEDALIAAEEQRKAIIPELIAAINRAVANPSSYLQGQGASLHSFAIYLLAQFHERQARDAVIGFFLLPDEAALDLTGDMIPENGGRILASICGSDPLPLHALVRNESASISARRAAIDALVVQAAWGWREREAVVEDFRQFFRILPRRRDSELWAGLVCAVCDLYATDLDQEVRQAFADELPDEVSIDLQSYEEFMAEGSWEDHANDLLFVDAIAECSEWNCFRDDSEIDPLDEDDDEELDSLLESDMDAEKLENELREIHTRRLQEREAETLKLKPEPKLEPYVAPPKVGRNDPCPCGSGKKYKKCCGK